MKPQILPDSFLRRMSKEDRKYLGSKAGQVALEANAKCDSRLEKEIHRQVEQWLNLHGIVYIHSRTDRKTTNAVGLADFCFVKIKTAASCVERAVPFAIEIKLPGKQPTKEQSDCMAKMRQNGWHTAAAHSLKEFIEIVTS